MTSVQETTEKIKASPDLARMVGLVVVICLVLAVSSFFLGRFSARASINNANNKAIYVEYPPLVDPYSEIGEERVIGQTVLTGQYVASQSGTKYYTLDCGGVSRIKEENKIYFDSIDEAENAGYEPADGCF